MVGLANLKVLFAFSVAVQKLAMMVRSVNLNFKTLDLNSMRTQCALEHTLTHIKHTRTHTHTHKH
jgi:hypothetical protein